MKIGCRSRAFVAAVSFYGVTAFAAEPPVVFVTQDGQRTALTVDAQTIKRLREMSPPIDANAAKAIPLRLDCDAIVRLRQDMRNSKPPTLQRTAPADGKAKAAESAADLNHQQWQTREWLDGLDRRFACGPRRSE